MAYTDEQRQFFAKAKAAGWSDDKIRAGIARLGERAPLAAVSPTQSTDPAAPTARSGAEQTVDEMGNLERGLVGAGGALHGLGLGAQQIWADLTGDKEAQERLRGEAAEHKRLMAPVDDTAAGFTGGIVGNAAAAAPLAMGLAATAPATLPGLVLAGGAEGLAMGALAPTTEEGERLENAAIGGTVGAVIPGAGKAVRKFVGEADPVVKRAAETLKKYGISVPKADQAPGYAGDFSKSMLENMPGINNVLAGRAADKEDIARGALFKMLGEEVPTSNEEMQAVVDRIGKKIGDASLNKRIPLKGLGTAVNRARDKYNQLLPSQQDKSILKHMAYLEDLAATPGAKLKGEAYQRIRSDLATEAARSSGEHASALRSLRDALDHQFGKTLSKEEAAAVAKNKESYQLAKALRKVDIKEGRMDLRKARARVEKAAEKAAVMPEARELLEAADVGIPKVKTGLSGAAMTQGALSLFNPILAAKFLAGGVGTRATLNTGVPQKAASNKVVREATARALKGYTQSELSDED